MTSAPRDSQPDERLLTDLKTFIVQHLKLSGIEPAAIPDDAPLLSGSLDLDSIDVLELVTGLEKKYAIRFENPELVQKVFRTVGTLAGHIAAERARA